MYILSAGTIRGQRYVREITRERLRPPYLGHQQYVCIHMNGTISHHPFYGNPIILQELNSKHSFHDISCDYKGQMIYLQMINFT